MTQRATPSALALHRADLNMVPLDTNNFITAWLPLRALTGAQFANSSRHWQRMTKSISTASPQYSPLLPSADDAALSFASGSHRDFALQYWCARPFYATGAHTFLERASGTAVTASGAWGV